jgi:hypothetical protein
VILDGVGDMVADVNDAEECNEFVARLHALAIKYDCAIPGVLHFNPGTEKTRGHLGSQLERKSESNLRLDKDGEITSVWSEKQRRAPILKGQGPRFTWSNDAGMHVSVSLDAISPKQAKEIADAKNLRDEVFSNRSAMGYCDLKRRVQEVTEKSGTTATRIYDKWVQFGIIEKSIGGLWTPKG